MVEWRDCEQGKVLYVARGSLYNTIAICSTVKPDHLYQSPPRALAGILKVLYDESDWFSPLIRTYMYTKAPLIHAIWFVF